MGGEIFGHIANKKRRRGCPWRRSLQILDPDLVLVVAAASLPIKS
jgi:hypothetical protein